MRTRKDIEIDLKCLILILEHPQGGKFFNNEYVVEKLQRIIRGEFNPHPLIVAAVKLEEKKK